MNDIRGEFSKRLKILRTEKNLTQLELSKELGYNTYTVITNWESGNQMPDIENLILLAKFFSVSIDFLVGLSEY